MEGSRRGRKKKSGKGLGIIIGILVIALALGIGGYATGLFGNKTHEDGDKPAQKNEKASPINPLTGLELENGKPEMPRPFILSTDNDSYRSRPQAGISEADILYEVPIEGGGSRYEPIYYSKKPGLIGAARSIRPYIMDIALEYNAVLVHNGQSPQAIAYFDSSGLDRISARDNFDIYHHEDLPRLPGNLYTTGDKVFDKMKELGYDKSVETRTFKWLKPDQKVSGQDASEIKVNYVDGSFNTFKYDPDSKLYTKYVKDQPLIDANNNKEIKCSNVIVQEVTLNLYDAQRLDLDLCEGGKATVFTQGKAIEASWERQDTDSPTIYKDGEGKEIKLTPGVTCFQIIDRTVKFNYK